jgi:hypothetical protein
MKLLALVPTRIYLIGVDIPDIKQDYADPIAVTGILNNGTVFNLDSIS